MRVVGVGRLLKMVNGAQEVQIYQSRCRPQQVAQYWVLSNLLVSPPLLRAEEGKKKLSYVEMKQEFLCFSLCLLPLALFAFTTEKSLTEAQSFRPLHHVSKKSARQEPMRRVQCEYSCLSVVEMARLHPQNTPGTGHKSSTNPCNSVGITLNSTWSNEDR